MIQELFGQTLRQFGVAFAEALTKTNSNTAIETRARIRSIFWHPLFDLNIL
jgi:hypothetical protein